MSQQYFTLLTRIGRNKLHAAISRGETLHLSHMAVGDGNGNPIDPSDSMTALVNETYRAPINDQSADPTNPTWAVFNMVIPVDAGGWYVREAGLYDTDGDLIFIGSLPENYKALPTQGVASDLAINMVVDIQRADSVTITVDPSLVLASKSWVGEAVETRMLEHNADPDAHAALVAALRESGDLVSEESIRQVVDAVLLDPDGPVRQRLREDLTIYVRTDGDDASDGLTETTAKATLVGAREACRSYEIGEHRIVIDLGEGEFDGANFRDAQFGVSNFYLVGQGTDKTFITSNMNAQGCISHVCIKNARLRVEPDQVLQVRHPDAAGELAFYRQSADEHCLVVHGGQLMYDGARLRFSGNLLSCLNAQGGGHIGGSVSSEIHVEDRTTFTNFLYCSQPGSGIYISTQNMTGQGQGRKYLVNRGGGIYVSHPDLLPGTVEGVCETPAIAAVQSTSARQVLTDDLTLYVRTGGNDANDGLTEATALATLAAAVQELTRYDCGMHVVTIDLGEGEFAGGTWYGPLAIGSGATSFPLAIQGKGKGLTRIISPLRFYRSQARLKDMALEDVLLLADKAEVRLDSALVKGNGGEALSLNRDSLLTCGDVAVEGEFTTIFSSNSGSTLYATHISITGPITCEYFARVAQAGVFWLNGRVTGDHAVTGRKFRARMGGVITCIHGDPNTLLPGTEDGICELPATAAIKAANSRTVLDSDLTLYVRTDGNDANDGLSEATAKKTLAAAVAMLAGYDPGNQRVTIQMGPGDFAGTQICSEQYSLRNLLIQGSGWQSTRVVSKLSCTSSLSVSDFSMYNCMLSIEGERVAVQTFTGQGTLGMLDGARLFVTGGGTLSLEKATVELSGQIHSPLEADFSGRICCGTDTLFRIAEGTAFTQGFVHARRGGQISFWRCSFEGKEHATGRKYAIYQGGMISGQGANASLENLPGDIPGELHMTGSSGISGVASAWARVNVAGGLAASYNIETVTKTGTGVYDINFLRPMRHDTSFAPLVNIIQTGHADCSIAVSAMAADRVVVNTYLAGVPTDMSFSLVVHE